MTKALKVGGKAWEREQQRLFDERCEAEIALIPAETKAAIQDECRKVMQEVLGNRLPQNCLCPQYICRNFQKGEGYTVLGLGRFVNLELAKIRAEQVFAFPAT